jgi:predicted TPR repeat methyltransferase
MSLNLLDLALSYHQEGNLKQAERIYQQLLEINPQDANILHLYGILSAQKGDFQQALDFIDAALNIDPTSHTFHNSMGNVLWYLENFSEAIKHYERSIQLEPNAPVAYNNLGNLYLKQEDYQRAIAYYQSAIGLKPDYSEAYYNLGIILAKIGRRQEAIQQLKKAVEYQPSLCEAHGQLGQLLQQENQLEEAFSHYQHRLQLEPHHVATLVNIGAILVKQGDLLQGIDYFQKALELKPDHTEAHYNLGSTYLSLQKTDEALAHFLQCLQEPPDADTYFNIGVIYMYKDRHLDAIEFFNSALKIRPDYLESHINLGATYLKIENYVQAIKHYQLALDLEPDNAEIEYILTAITEQKNAPKSAPQKFVRHLFDQYAPHFEKHLTQYLNYQAHILLYNFVHSHLKEKLFELTIVDLGCGTGLCGALFKSHAKKLIGVDLSAKMLEIAAQKNVYDILIEDDLVHALEKMTAVDLILAADVFGYLGDLGPVFREAHPILNKKGHFAFTVEKLEGESYSLQKSTRFAHSKQYIHALCNEYSFKIIEEREVQLRIQRQTPVVGYLYILEKNQE